jgi:hypothetical protein
VSELGKLDMRDTAVGGGGGDELVAVLVRAVV